MIELDKCLSYLSMAVQVVFSAFFSSNFFFEIHKSKSNFVHPNDEVKAQPLVLFAQSYSIFNREKVLESNP